MKTEVNPRDTNRAEAFQLWMSSPIQSEKLQHNQRNSIFFRRMASSFLEDYMIMGTSAMIQTELDSIVNQYTDKFCNPMVMWGKYRKHWFKTTLPISFQFHHAQMDGHTQTDS